MLQKIRKMIEQTNMVERGDCILVGCSGGADSVCLLLLMKEIAAEYGASLAAVHVEHGIRQEESIADARFVEKLCAGLGIVCYRYDVNAPEYAAQQHVGIEEAARTLRYQAFLQCAKECRAEGRVCIALAHHEEDNAETILFQLVRGSGLLGLCGMQPVRRDNGVYYIRPLLNCSRAEIEEYLAENGQEYCIDSTNSDETYSRNRIRRQIMPQLVQVNQRAVSHVNQTGRRLSVIYDYLRQQARAAYEEHAVWDESACRMDRSALTGLHPALQSEVVRMVLTTLSGSSKDITAEHVQAVLDLMDRQSGRRISLPNQVSVRVEYGELCFSKEEAEGKNTDAVCEVLTEQLEAAEKQAVPLFIHAADMQGEYCIKIYKRGNRAQEISKKRYTKMFDYDKIKDGFLIRNRMEGDYLVIDEAGHRKKLRNYFKDEKISSKERERLPLLARGHEIIWVVGRRIGANYKITDDTDTILEITYEGGLVNGRECEA